MENKGSAPSENEKVVPVSGYPSANEQDTVSSENSVKITKGPLIFDRIYSFKGLSLLLLILCLLSLAVLVIVSSLYVNPQRTKSLCNSEECIRSAANLRLSMNLDADPCEDFYEYTCGRWSSEHPNHGWFPSFSPTQAIYEKIAIDTMKFLKSEPTEDEPQPVVQTRDFFKSCMDVVSIDKKGYSVLFKYLKEANLSVLPQELNVTSTKEGINFNWVLADVTLKRLFAMDVFIGFTVDSEVLDGTKYAMYLGFPERECPIPSSFKKIKLKINSQNSVNDFDNSTEEGNGKKEFRKRIFKKVVNTIYEGKLEVPDDEALDKSYEIIHGISEEISDLKDQLEDSIEEPIPGPYTVEELQNLTDTYLMENNQNAFPIWNDYLKYMFQDIENVTLAFDGSDQLFTYQEELKYLQEIVHFLLKTPSAHIELYVWWVTVYAMIINTTSEISEYIHKLAAPDYDGDVSRSRTLRCASLVTDFMGMAVSYGIADKAFMNTTKPKVTEMLSEIKDAFTYKIKQLKWMDEETKNKTIEKTENMTSFIGFPEWLFEKGALENYYEGVELHSDTFLENMVEIVRTNVPHQLTLLSQKKVRSWNTDPVIVNAFNNFRDNAIMIPMAELSYPVFHLGLESLNYGAIGTILGHELTHGFDNSGRRYDKEGSYREWWTDESIKTFENFTKCFVDQYSNFSIPSVDAQVNGRRTLGENLADNGGLHHAYLAFKNHLSKHGSEPKLPGFETYTSDQLFFISYGSIWCETSSSDDLKYLIENDEHCPDELRLLGSLQNSEEFANSFKCPIGSRMNPNRTRCKIW